MKNMSITNSTTCIYSLPALLTVAANTSGNSKVTVRFFSQDFFLPPTKQHISRSILHHY